LQDDVEGLQVFQDERWLTVPAISDALLVLMGDQMEVWLMLIYHVILTG
jgi:isopenicillin N synthase-like dioxygenase